MDNNITYPSQFSSDILKNTAYFLPIKEAVLLGAVCKNWNIECNKLQCLIPIVERLGFGALFYYDDSDENTRISRIKDFFNVCIPEDKIFKVIENEFRAGQLFLSFYNHDDLITPRLEVYKIGVDENPKQYYIEKSDYSNNLINCSANFRNTVKLDSSAWNNKALQATVKTPFVSSFLSKFPMIPAELKEILSEELISMIVSKPIDESLLSDKEKKFYISLKDDVNSQRQMRVSFRRENKISFLGLLIDYDRDSTSGNTYARSFSQVNLETNVHDMLNTALTYGLKILKSDNS